jgi:hypothetical protein
MMGPLLVVGEDVLLRFGELEAAMTKCGAATCDDDGTSKLKY